MNSPGFQRRARAGRRLLAGALHDRLRQPVAEAEVVVGVVERRVTRSGRGTTGSARRRCGRAACRARRWSVRDCSSSRANRIAIACTSSPARPPTQWSGRFGAGVAEDVGARRHALAELVGKGGKRLLGHAERAQPIPRERQRDPASASSMVVGRVGCGLNLVEQFGQPGPAAGRRVERQELVAPGDGGRAGQQDVLDVVEFEHLAPEATASGRACPRRRPSAAAPS